MANHGYINTTSCTCWDVDAYNCAGVAATDLDNGVMVTLGNINRDSTSKKVKGYEFTVAAATDEATSVWVVATPEVGTSFDMQLLADPRVFYNKAGMPMSLKYLQPKVDCIEVNAEAFANSTLPTTSQGFVTIGTGGKLVAATSAPATAAYFSVVGFNAISAGMSKFATVILRTERN